MRLTSLRFECTGCGGCCTGKGDHYVGATRDEQRRIQRFLGISWRWFRRRYVVAYADGTEGLTWSKGKCAFLGENRRCAIYPVRPTQCRTYPFWPDVVKSREAWKAEAKNCEGIDRGAVIPLEEVLRRLRLEGHDAHKT